VKNKCAPPFTEAEFDIRWGLGIDSTSDLLDVAADSGIVEKNGAHFAFDGKSFAQGREKARSAMLDSPKLVEGIRTELAKTHGKSPTVVAVPPAPLQVGAA
jgi:recombination protein RecA